MQISEWWKKIWKHLEKHQFLDTILLTNVQVVKDRELLHDFPWTDLDFSQQQTLSY